MTFFQRGQTPFNRIMCLRLIVVTQAILWSSILVVIQFSDGSPQPLKLLRPIAFDLAQEQSTVGKKADYASAIDKLKQAVMNHYSYRDLRSIDWPSRFKELSPRLQQSKTDAEFANGVAELLSPAKDIHIWIEFNGKRIATYQANAVANVNPRALPKVLSSFKQHGTTVITGQATPAIQYVLIATWDHREPAAFQAALEAIQQSAKNKTPLIIDVRPNAGGDERQAQAIAALFTDKKLAYAASRPWQNGKPGEPNRRYIEPSKDGLKHPGPYLVLMGPNNMSSCESFLRMMRATDAKLVGATSMGTSGNPQPHDLGYGIRLYLPSWQQVDLDGKVIEGIGIQPDMAVPSKPSDFANSDPVLLRAIELLSQGR